MPNNSMLSCATKRETDRDTVRQRDIETDRERERGRKRQREIDRISKTVYIFKSNQMLHTIPSIFMYPEIYFYVSIES